MIIDSVSSALKNNKDSFYYCGIEISKNDFSITEFSEICDKINDLKHYIDREKCLSEVKEDISVIGVQSLRKGLNIICEVKKNKYFFSLYDSNCKEITPLKKDMFFMFNNYIYSLLSCQMNRTAVLYKKGIVSGNRESTTLIKNSYMLITFQNYKQNIEKLSNCFYHTYELEFINGYNDYILSDEQLKNALIER